VEHIRLQHTAHSVNLNLRRSKNAFVLGAIKRAPDVRSRGSSSLQSPGWWGTRSKDRALNQCVPFVTGSTWTLSQSLNIEGAGCSLTLRLLKEGPVTRQQQSKIVDVRHQGFCPRSCNRACGHLRCAAAEFLPGNPKRLQKTGPLGRIDAKRCEIEHEGISFGISGGKARFNRIASRRAPRRHRRYRRLIQAVSQGAQELTLVLRGCLSEHLIVGRPEIVRTALSGTGGATRFPAALPLARIGRAGQKRSRPATLRSIPFGRVLIRFDPRTEP
jgi:hypothetical protein